MKWLGQNIVDFITRFRNHVYVESIAGSTECNALVINSDGKMSSNLMVDQLRTCADNGCGGTVAGDYGTGGLSLTLTGGTGIDTSGSGGTGAQTVTFSVDLNETSTTTDTGDLVEGGYFAIVRGDAVTGKMAPSVIPISSFSNDSGFTSAAGDMTLAGTQTVTGVKTIGTNVKLQFRDANAYINSPGSNDLEIAATDITLDAAGDIDLETDLATFVSPNANDPLLRVHNTANDATGGRIRLLSARGAAGQDDDVLGTVQFSGYNDAGSPSHEIYGTISGEIHDATDGEESGRVKIDVANHDGGLGSGLILTGGSVNDEVDVTVGLGTASVTTVAGDLTVTGHNTKSLHYIHTENKFVADTSDEYYFSLTDAERDVAVGSEGGIGVVALMPCTGILKSVILNSSSNLSAKSWTYRLKKAASGTASTGESLVATVTSTSGGAGNTNKVVSFVTDPGDGTNNIGYESGFSATVMFNAGDRVMFSQQSDSDAAGTPKVQATFVFELNETTCL